MKNIWTIFKKEWDRVIKDKRLVISVMFLPGFMIFLIYSFIGTAINNTVNNTVYNVKIVNNVTSFQAIYDADTSISLYVTAGVMESIDQYKSDVDNETSDLLVVFSDGFLNYDGTNTKGYVYLYSNPNAQNSSIVYSSFLGYLNTYQEQLSYQLFGDTTYFSYQVESTTVDMNLINGTMLASLLPMLVVMFLFSGALSIGPESIAGEKERNTFSTLLITPVKRREIALGKILGLSVLSLLSAISSFIGILLSLPKLLQLQGSSVAIYGFNEYLMILVVLFSTVFVIVGMVSIISAFAKSVKEASTLIMPLYIITILVSITSLFNNNVNSNYFMYILPIYNTVQTLSAILRYDPNAVIYLIITVCANIVYLVLFVNVLNKMFLSEKIMFSK
ncbi:MAG: ABC transporter permease [Candidatus Izemoplasmatales bacterium]